MGALYFSLDQLLKKGFVQKTTKTFYQKKGGRSRTYYNLTSRGKKALEEVRVHQKSLWNGIPDMAFDAKKTK
jgi:DNA-binding PadR family transcriptional regulator